MRKGVDISVYEPVQDYSKLKAQGIEFAIIRCGYGKEFSQKDKLFDKHYEALKEQGIKVGAYLFSYATSLDSAVQEAKNCLDIIKGKHFDLPIFYDLEDDPRSKIKLSSLGKDKLTKLAKIFCAEIQNAGYRAGIYANLDWFTNLLDVSQLDQYYIWLAQWTEKHTAPFRVDFWQYTENGHVLGINSFVDLNIQYCDIIEQGDQSLKNFVVGQTYKLNVDLKVRKGPSTNYEQKNYSDLTPNAKSHAYVQEKAVLKKGTKVTCQACFIYNNEIWLQIPSGYVCGYYHGKNYIY